MFKAFLVKYAEIGIKGKGTRLFVINTSTPSIYNDYQCSQNTKTHRKINFTPLFISRRLNRKNQIKKANNDNDVLVINLFNYFNYICK